MKKIKKSYISIYYLIPTVLIIFLSQGCTTSKDPDLNGEDLAISYDFNDTFSIEYEGNLIDLDSVSNDIKQKFYHNENLYQTNLNTLFKDIVIEKYIKDISSNDHISLEEATSKAYSSLGFSFLGLNELEKKEELFKKILEQKQIKLSLKRPQYPSVNLETKDFPRIKTLDNSNESEDNNTLQIIVFSSLSCLKCKNAYTWLKELSSDTNYKDRLEIIYKPLTLSDLDFLVQFEKGALCANSQNFFNAYIDYIYEHLSEISDLTPIDVIKNIQGINLETFNTCLSTPASQLDISNKEAESLGIYTTPSFFINSRLYPKISSIQDLKDILDEN